VLRLSLLLRLTPASVDHPATANPPTSDSWGSQARRWGRAALALALLFASLPLAGKLFFGGWGFDGAAGIAFLFLSVAAYLYFVGRTGRPSIPDSASILDEAIRRAAAGDSSGALALRTDLLWLDPRLWQAWQYRGQIRLGEPEGAESALQDFTEAIRLAPGEPHLYVLRSYAFSLLGRDAPARDDLETAARLGGDSGAADR
jgi:tetratricopeptide (TPR) repeat protein